MKELEIKNAPFLPPIEDYLETLKGYERVVNAFKSEGFDSAMSVKEYCQNYAKLLKENAELKETLQHREHCIDWIIEHHPEVITEYLERK